MDPLSAFGLACGIVQIVDFGLEVFSTCRDLAQNASTKKNLDLGYVTSHLADLSKDIETAIDAQAQPKTRADRELRDLACRCKDTSNALQKKLSALNVNPQKKGLGKLVEVTRKVAESIWKSSELKELRERLEGYRKMLDTSILTRLSLIVRTQAVQQEEGFRKLNTATQYFIAGLQDNQRSVLDLSRTIRNCKHEVNAHVSDESQETRRAVLDASQNTQAQSHRQHRVTRKVIIREAKLLRQHLQSVEAQREQRQIRITRLNRLKDSLWFPDLWARHRAIDRAADRTFEWIFDAALKITICPRHKVAPCDHKGCSWASNMETARTQSRFRRFMERETGLFWVNGKPGSGKTTLMSFIASHGKTQDLLKTWKHNDTTIILTFFFWRGGSIPELRTSSGMLRSLLHQCLDARPSLSSLIMHPALMDLTRSSHAQTLIWSEHDLLTALQAVLTRAPKTLSFCMFIDGLDEFDGPKQHIVKIIDRLLECGDVKVVVSSRPEHGFWTHLPARIRLRLEDLTYSDMETFATSEVLKHPHGRRLLANDPARSNTLREKVTKKAEGVFLWVALAVKSVLAGLDSEDSLDEIEERLAALPRGLDHLWRQILSDVHQVHQRKAAHFFRLLICHQDSALIPALGPMDIVDFVLADAPEIMDIIEESEGLDDVMHKYNMIRADLLEKCPQMLTQLQSRCGGMLSVNSDTEDTVGHLGSWPEWTVSTHVSFSHRSAQDFLLEDDAGVTFLGLDEEARRLANKVHCNRLLRRLIFEALEHWRNGSELSEHAIAERVSQLLQLCGLAAEGPESGSWHVLDKAQLALDRFWPLRMTVSQGPQPPLPQQREFIDKRLISTHNFLGLAATHNLVHYASSRMLSAFPSTLTPAYKTYLLSCTLEALHLVVERAEATFTPWGTYYDYNTPDMVCEKVASIRYLVEIGAGVNSFGLPTRCLDLKIANRLGSNWHALINIVLTYANMRKTGSAFQRDSVILEALSHLIDRFIWNGASLDSFVYYWDGLDDFVFPFPNTDARHSTWMYDKIHFIDLSNCVRFDQVEVQMIATPLATMQWFEVDATWYQSFLEPLLAFDVPQAYKVMINNVAVKNHVFSLSPSSGHGGTTIRSWPKRPSDTLLDARLILKTPQGDRSVTGEDYWAAVLRYGDSFIHPFGADSCLDDRSLLEIWRAEHEYCQAWKTVLQECEKWSNVSVTAKHIHTREAWSRPLEHLPWNNPPDLRPYQDQSTRPLLRELHSQPFFRDMLSLPDDPPSVSLSETFSRSLLEDDEFQSPRPDRTKSSQSMASESDGAREMERESFSWLDLSPDFVRRDSKRFGQIARITSRASADVTPDPIALSTSTGIMLNQSGLDAALRSSLSRQSFDESQVDGDWLAADQWLQAFNPDEGFASDIRVDEGIYVVEPESSDENVQRSLKTHTDEDVQQSPDLTDQDDMRPRTNLLSQLNTLFMKDASETKQSRRRTL